MTLKTKARIYRLTGIYLAQKEQDAHIDKSRTQYMIKTWAAEPENEMTVEDAESLAVGLWQANHGFSRSLSLLRYNHPAFFWKPIAFFVETYKSIF